jgi:hypothetical protein
MKVVLLLLILPSGGQTNGLFSSLEGSREHLSARRMQLDVRARPHRLDKPGGSLPNHAPLIRAVSSQGGSARGAAQPRSPEKCVNRVARNH